ncbi:TonB-dependent receptor [Piscinibacter sakaiensis]|uniref:Ferrichrome-iron receptor n=1 Tax=Piscinibacter sakaiensis TaxID=1547922 RepID=A0A0K8P141_PISS1|nr:TonB-dependent receptor [Piscinibacter sakaiensis]GAP36343.1 ferrichrome-iron receptor [Piscinibacter sakaiensis]
MHAHTRFRTPRRTQVWLAVLAGVALHATPAAAASPAEGGTSIQASRYDLPAAPLVVTLDAIARQSGRSISFDRARLADQPAPAVRGNYTPRQAVEAALQGAPLRLGDGDGGVLNVYVVGDLGVVSVFARRDQAEKGFKADRSETATRSGTDLMDLAGGMTIITGKVMETQQATNLRETLRNVSGIGFTDSPQGLPVFSVRGFNRPSTTTNGLSDQNASQTNVYAVERLEVLKGPQAILSGARSLGGGVNVVLKRPSAEPVRDLTIQYGSDSDRTVAGDLSNAFTDDKRLTYRLVASSTRAGTTDAGVDGRKDDAFIPQIRWKDASTDLIAGLSYHEAHVPVPRYTFARRDGVIMPTPGIALSNPADGFDTRERRVFYQFEHKLSPDITLVSRLQHADDVLRLHAYSSNAGLEYASGAADSQPNGTVRVRAGLMRTLQRQTAGDHYVRMNFGTGDIDHKFVVGVNHESSRLQQTQWTGAPQTALTLYPQPVPLALPASDDANPLLSNIASNAQRQQAVYLQDQLSWNDWTVQLNWRRTLVTQESFLDYREFNVVSATPPVTVGKNIPGAGVVYRLNPSTSLYGALSNGFDAQTNVSCGGGLVPPIGSKNKELGAKFSLLGNRLSVTAAAFQIDQSGTLVYDRARACYNVRDAQRTRGMEFDLQGQLAPGWQAIVNYTYSTSKDVGNPATLFPGKPRHKASLWTTYSLPQVQGLGVGLGISGHSAMLGSFDTRYPFTIPKQYQIDASAFYDIPNWSFTFGIKNLTDRQLYGGTTASAFVPVLPGRKFLLTARRSFN